MLEIAAGQQQLVRVIRATPLPASEQAYRILINELPPAAGSAHAGLNFVMEFSVRSEEHTSELQSLMRSSYAVFGLNKKNNGTPPTNTHSLHAPPTATKHSHHQQQRPHHPDY